MTTLSRLRIEIIEKKPQRTTMIMYKSLSVHGLFTANYEI